MPNLSVFPSQIDTFIAHFDAIASDIPYLKRIEELRMKENKTPAEQTELTDLITAYRDKLFLAQDLNKLQDAIVNLETFFTANVEDHIQEKQKEFQTYIDNKTNEILSQQNTAINTINTTKADAVNKVNLTVTNAETSIQNTKDSALIAIEQKKENILTYMDSTTAGQIRNDIGVMGELTTNDKSSLVAAVNEVNAKNPIHIGTTPPSDTSVLWVDTN